MNIQRKYSLPNCTILLEGLSDITRVAQLQELRPELSILVNAECYLANYPQPLAGGREFFESLVRAVSSYAQEFLSNITNSQTQNPEPEIVKLQKIGSNQHRLIVQLGTEPGFDPHNHLIQIDLNTVQLFDLVEAIDQFFADSQTLPELSLELQPVTGQYGGNQALIKQAIPATVGISSLVVTAIAFSLIPAPQVRPPEPNVEPKNLTLHSTPTITPTPVTSAVLAGTPTPEPNVAKPPTTDLEALLNTVPEITDPSQLRSLNRQVYNQIHPAWTSRSQLKQDLIYRLGVAADGSIVGYKAVNREANAAIEQTPLPNLLYNPAKRQIAKEPIAQFRVVFTQQGILEVSPWLGYTKPPTVLGEKISDRKKIKDLEQKLYSTIRQSWSVTPSFSKDLKYRVAINKDGVIADYEPLNQLAFDHFRETPLPQMFQSVYGSNVAAPNDKEALAHFQVVFQPNGKLKITPWRGYR